MLGIYPAILLFCVTGQFDINGLVTLEARAGQAPLDTSGQVEWGVIGIATPDVQLSYLSRTADVRLDYGPRIFWREPNDTSTLRPLILHVGAFNGTLRATRRLGLFANATGSVGEADYTALGQILPGQAALPAVVDFLSVSSTAGMVVQTSRLSELSNALTFIHRRPLGAAADVKAMDPTMPPPFPRQTSLSLTSAFKLMASRQDEISVSNIVSYGTYSGNVDIFTVVPEARWRMHLSPRYDLRVGAGIAYAHVNPALDAWSPVSPVGELGLDMRLSNSAGASTRASVLAQVDYFIDPVLSTAGPRALLTAGWWDVLNPDWQVGVEGMYATVFTGTNAPVGTTLPDETTVSLYIPVRHRASDHVLMEFGFRYADRAPSVEVSAFGFHQRQLWLYYMVTGTTRRPTSRSVQ